MGLVWTQAQAEAALMAHVNEFAADVACMVKVATTPGQMAALVSFAYNLGAGKLRASTLLALLNAGNYAGAALQFKRWNRAGGKVLLGLTNRRAEEAAMFGGAP